MNEAVSASVEDGDADGKRENALQRRGCLFLCLKRLFLDRACAIEEMGREAVVAEEGSGDLLHALQYYTRSFLFSYLGSPKHRLLLSLASFQDTTLSPQ